MVTWGFSVLIGGLPTKLMRTAAVLVLSAFLTCTIDAASNSLVSSVEDDGRESACPGEVVRYTCTVVDTSNPLIATTLWRGSAFDCDPDDEIQLNHQDFNTTGDSGVCGDLTAQSEGQDGTCFTSVLTLPEANEGMSGKTIECSLSGVIPAGSDTVAVASCPAPTITITEVTPESVNVSINGYPEDTLLCSYTLMGRVTDESGQIVQTFSITNETSVIVDGLDLCRNVYTFEVSVMCGNVISDSTTRNFSATLRSLDPVTNVRSDDNFVSLDWDAPANAPANCIMNYQIVVSGFSTFNTTTDDSSTSILVSSLNLDTCEEYFVMVTPITVRIGVVETSRSDPHRLTLVEGFPTPGISTIDFIYIPQGIAVNVTWENDLLPQFANAVVLFDCGSEDICTPVSLSDSSSSHSLTLSYSVLGLDIEFSVTFLSPLCQRRTSITMSFSNILESVDISDVTHNTAAIVVVYNSSISTLEGYTVRATIYPQNSTGPVQLFTQEVPFPPVSAFEDQLTFSFTSLEAATDYVFDVGILSVGIVIGRAEHGTFTTESEPESGEKNQVTVTWYWIVPLILSQVVPQLAWVLPNKRDCGLSTGAAVGISIAVTFFGTFVLGTLFGAAIVYIVAVKRQMKTNYEPSTAQSVQGAPVYEEPELIARKIDTATNVAYGHTRF